RTSAVDSLPYSVRATSWGRYVGSRDDGGPRPELGSLYKLTRPLADCPHEPAFVDVTFAQGIPVEINGVPMPLVELLANLDMIAGAHGVGRSPLGELLVGPGIADTVPVESLRLATESAVVRSISEAPAATVLQAAHAALRRLVMPEGDEDADRNAW